MINSFYNTIKHPSFFLIRAAGEEFVLVSLFVFTGPDFFNVWQCETKDGT